GLNRSTLVHPDLTFGPHPQLSRRFFAGSDLALRIDFACTNAMRVSSRSFWNELHNPGPSDWRMRDFKFIKPTVCSSSRLRLAIFSSSFRRRGLPRLPRALGSLSSIKLP